MVRKENPAIGHVVHLHSFKHHSNMATHKKSLKTHVVDVFFPCFFPCFSMFFSHRKPLHWGWTDESSGPPSASSIVRHHALGPRRVVGWFRGTDRTDPTNGEFVVILMVIVIGDFNGVFVGDYCGDLLMIFGVFDVCYVWWFAVIHGDLSGYFFLEMET